MRSIRILSAFVFSICLLLPGGGNLSAATDATIEGWVTVSAGGIMSVQFCGGIAQDGSFKNQGRLDFSSPTVSLEADSKATAHLQICYTDTQATRGAFTTSLRAGGFRLNGNGTPQEWVVKPTSVNFEIAGRSGVGYIGVFDGLNKQGMDTGQHPWQGADLKESQRIGYANAGGGTAGFNTDKGRFIPGTVIGISLEVTIPAGTAPGSYGNTFILDIIPGDI